uniref:Uncharacterized protein n=1 Tax=Arundo donax TaxID=35708 RepID=A0A0A9BSF3_ARUDO
MERGLYRHLGSR